VTHLDHGQWMRDLLNNRKPLEHSIPIDLILIDTPSILERTETTPTSSSLWSQHQQEQCIEACIRNRHKRQGGGEEEQETTTVDLILCNLFALEGLVIGDVIDKPIVVLHPYPPPSPQNETTRHVFISTYLKEEWPHLFEKLRCASALDGASPCSSLTYEDFVHWVNSVRKQYSTYDM
jgi:hypothetical protein